MTCSQGGKSSARFTGALVDRYPEPNDIVIIVVNKAKAERRDETGRRTATGNVGEVGR